MMAASTMQKRKRARIRRLLAKGEIRLSGRAFKDLRGEVAKVCRASDLPRPGGRHERAA